MNAKISVFVICVEAIILLYNLHDCTYKNRSTRTKPRHIGKDIRCEKYMTY